MSYISKECYAPLEGASYLSKEELLKAIGEEPIVEDEDDKTQIAMVLQYRKFVDIVNSLPTYTCEQLAEFYNNYTKVQEVIDYLFGDNNKEENNKKQFRHDLFDEWVSYNNKLSTKRLD